jgi:hypothetical protein
MNDDPFVRARAIAKLPLLHQPSIQEKEVLGATFGGFVRLRAVVGALSWISVDRMRLLRGREPRGAGGLQDGFIEAMAREGGEP